MNWVYDDGGRADGGYKGKVGDCFCRAVSIAVGIPYEEAYRLINECAKGERRGCRKHSVSNARSGVYTKCAKRVMERLGWTWKPTMTIGSGCKVHLRESELPKGRIICSVTKHYVAVVDGVIHDTFDSSTRTWIDEDGLEHTETDNRCVYGYFYKE